MDIEALIEKIVDDGRNEDMHKLSQILVETMQHLKKCNEEKYKKYETCLYELAYGKCLNKEMAEKIVSEMRPYRMKWDIEETRKLQREFNVEDIRDIDFFVVLNSAYNDYRDLFGEDIDKYVKFTIDFIDDEDAKEEKVYLYFTQIPN